MLLPILKGCNSWAQLEAAWTILTQWLDLGRQFIKKYKKEFKNPNSITDYSPASTSVQLRETLSEMPTADAQL